MNPLEPLRRLGITPKQYLLRYVLPGVGGGVALAILFVVLRDFLPPLMAVLLPIACLAIGVAAGVLAPNAILHARRQQIDQALPFFITHFGVLATSNLPRRKIILILSEKKEYKALAKELTRIHDLVSNWNLPLPEAARRVGAVTASPIFGDFLERLAYGLEAGQDLENFLRAEQAVVLREYAAVYANSVFLLEKWKELYLSVVSSTAFFTIFMAITPLLLGGKPMPLMVGVMVFFVVLQGLLFMLLQSRRPRDQLVTDLARNTRQGDKQKQRTMLIAPWGIIILFVTVALGAPLELAASLGVVPFLVLGFLFARDEAQIKRREENYAPFIRSLGAATGARGGSLRDTLDHVRGHNFGPLTQLVEDLYLRLTWRIDDEGAWRQFAADSGSHLIDSFNGMFVEGVRNGGKPGTIGELISKNVVEILSLRTSRYATSDTFRTMLITMTAATAFAMFVGVAIAGFLVKIFVTTTDLSALGQLALPVPLGYDVGLVNVMVLVTLLIHSAVGPTFVKVMDGGLLRAGWTQTAFLVWIVCALSYVTPRVVPKLLNIG